MNADAPADSIYLPYFPFTPEAVAEGLERSADLLEVRGHCKGTFESTDGRLCAMGALRAICRNDMFLYVVTRIVEDHLDHVGMPSPIPIWNDKPEREGADVIDTFRTIAKDYRNLA